MKYHNTYLITIILSLFAINVKSQTFKEVVDFHSNGQKKTEYVKNIDLELIRENIFDINGELIEFTSYDPVTGRKDGEFMLGSNRGFFNQGKLNCQNCSILTKKSDYSDYPDYSDFKNIIKNAIIFKGNFKEGKPNGKIKVYKITETGSSQIDPFTSYLRSLDANRKINYSTYFGVSFLDEKLLYEINYNENGNISGKVHISNYSSLVFEEGVISEVYSLNQQNTSIYKDSIGRNFKVWKINNRYSRNLGWLDRLSWNEFNGDTKVDISATDIMDGITFNIFFGNENTKYIDGAPLVAFNFSGYDDLNEYGIFQGVRNPKFYDYYGGYNLTELFFEVPIDLMDEFSPMTSISDVSLNRVLEKLIEKYSEQSNGNIRDKKNNPEVLELLKRIEQTGKYQYDRRITISTLEYYQIMNDLIENYNSSISDVYLVNAEKAINSSDKPNYTPYKDHHKAVVAEAKKDLIQ